MSGGIRLAVCAAAATLAAAGALLPLVDRSVWIVQAAFLLAVQTSVGVLARRVPLARALTVAVQALVALLLLTVVFARAHAIGGLLPGPEVFQEFGQLLREGASDVGRYAIPAPTTTAIRLLLVGGVLVIGLVVDALAVTYRSAAPAGLPLLALYSVAAGLAEGTDWLWFLAAAAGYLLLLLAEGRDRLAQWGRVFGGGGARPGPAAHPLGPGQGSAIAPVRTGRRIGALALGIALLVPAVLPTMDSGLLQAHGQSPGEGGTGGGTGAVSPLVALQDSLRQPENREVLRYRTSTQNTGDLYLRIVTLDQFDGSTWRTSPGRPVTEVPDPLPTPAGLAPGVRTDPVNTSVAASGSYAQTYLPLPYPAEQVRIGGRWRYEPEGRMVVGGHAQTTRGARYQVTSLLVEPTAAQLAAAPAPPQRLLREYTKVPGSVPAVVARTARKVTAGAANPYQQAVKLQEWFAVDGGFRYDTEVRSGSGPDAIARFLQAKEGFCVHFSFAMAAMARTLGIPARVAVGFTPGTPQADGSMSVGSKDAHAWPELYFEGAGWTRFEPTPSRGTPPEYTVAETPAGSDPGAPSARPDRSAAPSAPTRPDDECTGQLKKADGCPALAQQPGGGATDDGPPAGTVTAVVVAALVVLLLPVLPMLWRRRVRARRLRPADASRRGPGEEAETAGPGGRPVSPAVLPDDDPAETVERTLAAWRELTDSAWDYGILPDDAQTPRKAAARIVRAGALDGPSAESAVRVATAVEQALYAPTPRPAGALAAEVETVRAGLRAAAGRGARLRAVLAPRSAARVAWACSRRWSAALERLRSGRIVAVWRRAGGALRLSRQRG
ncbi:Protein-glutamine gamma-glutamyltransferase [Streptomyces netropsis]|nr:Protein-glutamine gamma-glutamyltransferase [Streptomyces netropsis]